MNVQIRNLSKVYGDRKVLDIDTLNIAQGTIVGIIGPNGAGKSTLIKIMAGLESPTQGDIFFDGLPPNKVTTMDMTLVFQKPYLLSTRVFHDVAYPLRLRKMKKEIIQTKVQTILEEMDLWFLRNQKTGTLSGGEIQKVSLARALVFQPKLLFLDEPTANIDPTSIFVMEKMIKKINKENKTTVIIITHNIVQAKRLCQDIVFMDQGRIVEKGSRDTIINNPQETATKNFIKGELII
ncbi:ABC transporter ATP-binding protein [Dehalobacterium formicoaceticum]|uniref:ABC transporter ATP-binding protein n=1 Tax=Dehalobacterium formicoaceticum TaxID=51515 RepID=UPI000B801C84|nr:ATP-binding cassette domain-containing protein [Dehalobacterium formicoaceticum]